jgi:hypothetical protein
VEASLFPSRSWATPSHTPPRFRIFPKMRKRPGKTLNMGRVGAGFNPSVFIPSPQYPEVARAIIWRLPPKKISLGTAFPSRGMPARAGAKPQLCRPLTRRSPALVPQRSGPLSSPSFPSQRSPESPAPLAAYKRRSHSSSRAPAAPPPSYCRHRP